MVECDAKLKLEQYAQEYANDPEFVAEGLSMKVVERMLELLKTKGLNQSWLAKEMGVSRAHISKILNAQPNMTFLTFAKIAIALGVDPDVDFKSKPKPKEQSKSIDFSWLTNGQPVYAENKTVTILPGTTSLTNNAAALVPISVTVTGTPHTEGIFMPAAVSSKPQMLANEPELVLAA